MFKREVEQQIYIYFFLIQETSVFQEMFGPEISETKKLKKKMLPFLKGIKRPFYFLMFIYVCPEKLGYFFFIYKKYQIDFVHYVHK